MPSVNDLLSAREAAFNPVDGWATLDLSPSAKLALALLHACMDESEGFDPPKPELHCALGFSKQELQLALNELVLAGVLYKKVERDGEGCETRSGYCFVGGRHAPGAHCLGSCASACVE